MKAENLYIIEIGSDIGLSIDIKEKKLIINYDAYSADSSIYVEYDIKFNPFTGESLDLIKNRIDSNLEKIREIKKQKELAIETARVISEIKHDLLSLKKFNQLFKVIMVDETFRMVSGNSKEKVRKDFPHISKSKVNDFITIIAK